VTAPLTLAETADLLGRYRHVELSLFARLGGRAPSCEDAAVVVYLAGASRAHGFRAGLVEPLLPVSDGLPRAAELTRSPGERFDEALEVLTAGSDGELLDALVGTFYPAMAAGYAEHLAVAVSPADAAVHRMLRRLLADLAATTAEGRVLAPPSGGTPRSARVHELLEKVPGPFGPLRRTP
jgi:hypothetical protein